MLMKLSGTLFEGINWAEPRELLIAKLVHMRLTQAQYGHHAVFGNNFRVSGDISKKKWKIGGKKLEKEK